MSRRNDFNPSALACVLLSVTSAQAATDHRQHRSAAPHTHGTKSASNTAQKTAISHRPEQISVVGASGTQAAEARLRQVPGATAVISAREFNRGRATTMEDVLAFQPGIYAQSTSGSTANKISIRGSGAGVFYGGYSIGMKYLIDGMTISGTAGLQEDRLSPIGYQRVEVLYAANAFDYASTALGGAINFIAATGRSSPGTNFRWEGGSFGTSVEQASQGGTFAKGKGDYYVVLGRTDRQGYQAYTRTYRTDVDFNVGYRVTDNLTVRAIGRWDEGASHYGGLLTLAQIRQNTAQNPNNWGQRPTESAMLGLKAIYDFADRSRLEYGLTLNRYTLTNNEGTLQPQLWRSTDVNNSLRYTRHDKLLGKSSDTAVILSNVEMVSGDSRYFNTRTAAWSDTRDSWALADHTHFQGSHDSVLAVTNNTEILHRLWLTTGLSGIWIYRNANIVQRLAPNPNAQSKINYNAVFAAPRLGLRYALDDTSDIYANITRSIDPPVTWQYQYAVGGNPYNNTASVSHLEAQRGYTVELGIRGQRGPFQGSLTFYRSWVHDELLSVVVKRATASTAEIDATSNASPTIHQGIEAGLDTTFLTSRTYGNVVLRQTATVNDFRYVDDAVMGHNRLPGLPLWVYQAQLEYRHHSGFYANANFRATSSYYADYANTLKAPSYGIWGLRLGYEAPTGRWTTFLDLRNLANKRYVTATYTQYSLHGMDTAAFYPGDGFGAFGGVTLHL